MTDDKALLNVKDVAAELDVSIETVRRWLRSGQLAGLYLSDKAGWRIRRTDLDRFLEGRYKPALQ